jgi:hypothetical protein
MSYGPSPTGLGLELVGSKISSFEHHFEAWLSRLKFPSAASSPSWWRAVRDNPCHDRGRGGNREVTAMTAQEHLALR